MTRIKSIVMHGFKSFAKRTEMVFDDNFNVVLGPNGSGKSNVLDALCFVLGKRSAKSLRAEKASNLIYNGGKKKTPSKEAEVSIIFDNTSKIFPIGRKEVKVTRIIKHTGQSVYKIDDKRRTRQQIIDLLALAKINPDGYNIILQGDIVRFVEMSPNERRDVIGEIAGITSYEEKKNKALKELEKVDGKMNDAEIILKERSLYLKELKKERNQALKFKELNDKEDQNLASILKIQLEEQTKKVGEVEGKEEKQQQDLEKQNQKIKTLREKISEKQKEVEEIKNTVGVEGDEDTNKLNDEIETLREKLTTNKTQRNSHTNELERIEGKKNNLLKELADIEGDKDDQILELKDLETTKKNLAKEVEEINKKIFTFKQKHGLGEESERADKEMEQIDKDSEEIATNLEQLRAKQHELLRKNDSLEIKISTVKEIIEKVEKISKEHKGQLKELGQKRENFKRTAQDLNKALDEDSALAAQLSNARQRALTVNEELSKAAARSASIKERSLGDIAINTILKNKSQFGGVNGVMSDLGEVNSKYSLALEIAAGNRLKSLVVENDGVAGKCINYLKNNRLGTATFLPLNKLKNFQFSNELKEKKGVYGYALDLVEYDPKFRKAFAYVFGNTLVVENIETARSIGIGKVRMVTLTGDLMETSGAMQGGFRKRQKGLGFKEKELGKDLKELEKKVTELKEIIRVVEGQKTENEELIDKLRTLKAELEGEIIKTEKSLHLDDHDLDATSLDKKELEKEKVTTEKELEGIRKEVNEENKQLISFKTKKAQLREKINQIKNPILLAELTSFEQKRDELKEKLITISAQIAQSNTHRDQFSNREKDRINRLLKDQEKEQGEFKEEIKTLKERIGIQTKELKEKEDIAKKLYSKFKSLFDRRARLGDEINKEDKELGITEERARGIESRMNMLSIAKAEQRAKLASLEDQFSPLKEVKTLKKPIEELQKEIRALERMKENIGSVNMKALEIYESVEEKYNSLVEKKNILEEEKVEIMKMMEEIEERKKEIFIETFKELNEKFKETFEKISTKGSQVYLELENKEKPFEGGMNIKAKITGSRYLDIRSLSGGEKTMTALAFIFAIQEYDPASFYILDEVDAALDKHNSEKLAGLIKTYTPKAQYVVISHNDAIISQSNNLYGVSMDEHGISKVVSLKI